MVEVPSEQIALARVLVAVVEDILRRHRNPRHKAEAQERRLGPRHRISRPTHDEVDIHRSAHGAVRGTAWPPTTA